MITYSRILWGVALILLSTAAGITQTPPPPRSASDINVEIVNLLANKYVASVPAGGVHSGLYGNGRLRRIADWKPSADAPLSASVLKIEFWLEQDAVKVEVLAFLGEAPPNSRPPDWERLQKIKIASRLVRVDETIKIEETIGVGIEPFEVKVARAAPWSIGPPEVVNKTQSLNLEGTTEERPEYTVTVRNVSTKNISAIEWYGAENDRRGGGGGVTSALLIPAGKPFQIHQRFSTAEDKRTDDSQPQLAMRRQIVIAAVLFDDGSFEGDVEAAARMAVRWTGESLQMSRLFRLMQTASASSDPDQTTVLAKLKADIEAQNDEADPEIAAKVVARFPGLSEELRRRTIANDFKAGLRSAKAGLLREIEIFQFQQAHSPEAKDLRKWLTETVDKYKKLQAPYL